MVTLINRYITNTVPCSEISNQSSRCSVIKGSSSCTGLYCSSSSSSFPHKKLLINDGSILIYISFLRLSSSCNLYHLVEFEQFIPWNGRRYLGRLISQVTLVVM